MRKLEGKEKEKAISWINKNFGLNLSSKNTVFANDGQGKAQASFRLVDGRLFGKYVGDGEDSQNITGLGVKPKAIFIKKGVIE